MLDQLLINKLPEVSGKYKTVFVETLADNAFHMLIDRAEETFHAVMLHRFVREKGFNHTLDIDANGPLAQTEEYHAFAMGRLEALMDANNPAYNFYGRSDGYKIGTFANHVADMIAYFELESIELPRYPILHMGVELYKPS